ncbi:MAG: (Fe-S)-binding protein [Bacteroidetes bacterium]|nr:(Fe-S)-binding protein [Bacteroidota bacterium]
MDRQRENLSELISDDLLTQCIHCGICLSVCPTYDITKLERSSPRGRIRLIKAFANNEISLGKLFEDEMSFCLGCRACETACPAGVQYENLHQKTKHILNKGRKFSVQKIALKYFLNKILTSSAKLKSFSRMLFYYQKSWLRKFLHSTSLLKNIFPKLFLMDELSPQISDVASDELIDEISLPENEQKYNVAFHVGCIMNVAFAEINLDTIEVLKKSGCKIYTPINQNCCGALHAHNGELNTAKGLAKSNIDLFEKFGYEYLISNSAGCGAFMKEYVELFNEDKRYTEKAEKFSSKVKDISEFITENDINLKYKRTDERVTYHDACHLVHGQGVFKQPREIINSLPGISYNELNDSTRCCGSAGIYNILRQEDSMLFLDQKMENIIDTNADIVLTSNPGCLLQLRYGVKKYNKNINIKHIVSFVNSTTKNEKKN